MDAELDPDDASLVQTSGPAVVTVGGSVLTGTVDPRGSGTFVSKASVRIVAGAAGWDKAVPPLHYHADNGVVSTAVYAGAAGLVLETVIDATPLVLGVDFMRSAGPASRVFGDRDWYVDLTGVTQVATRLPAVPDPSQTLINWDPIQQRAELTSDALVMPGTVLSDTRLGTTTPTVRDVEQIFDANGSKVTAWCAQNSVTRLVSALTNLVRELARTAALKVYQYRVALEGPDGRLSLQAVNPAAGMPDTLPLSLWPGMSGDSAKLKPSSLVLVHFVEQGGILPPQPVILGCDPTSLPLERVIDATVDVRVGPSAPLVALAGGATPLALGPWATALQTALSTFAVSMFAASTGPLTPMAAPAAALSAAVGTLPPASTLKTVAA